VRILGIDYGLAKVGLALADDGLAQVFGVVKNNDSLIKKISEVCQANEIEKIVIGLPEGKVAQKAKKFGQELISALNLPLDFQDETLTSQEATAKMIEAGKKKKYRQTKSDAFAAAIILQTYLDAHV
jgi:putative Holliday junction resolvase